jgi:hypothetical protein
VSALEDAVDEGTRAEEPGAFGVCGAMAETPGSRGFLAWPALLDGVVNKGYETCSYNDTVVKSVLG